MTDTDAKAPPQYEEQFTVFVDFLGFSEISKQADESKRLGVLALLQMLATFRGEFAIHREDVGGGKRIQCKPSVSTFSDHIVISYPLDSARKELDNNENLVAAVLIHNALRRIQHIAIAALDLGLLIRGGATIGKLYHADGVVFGDALIEAHEIESQVAFYPRVVLSQRITNRFWTDHSHVRLEQDGLYTINYFNGLAPNPMTDIVKWEETRAWHQTALRIIEDKLHELDAINKPKELAKWQWFAREARNSFDRMSKAHSELMSRAMARKAQQAPPSN